MLFINMEKTRGRASLGTGGIQEFYLRNATLKHLSDNSVETLCVQLDIYLDLRGEVRTYVTLH